MAAKKRTARNVETRGLEAILARLDEGMATDWPSFEAFIGAAEYHALRLLAFGDLDAWAVVLFQATGDLHPDPDYPYAANLRPFLYRSSGKQGAGLDLPLPLSIESTGRGKAARLVAVGPRGSLTITAELLEEHDVRVGATTGYYGEAASPEVVTAIRAYLAAHPDALWPPPDVVRRHLGIGGLPLLLETSAFEHVVPPKPRPRLPAMRPFAMLPSTSTTYRSLAEALAHRDATRFVAGTSNLDWRRWAVSG
jgi:hypothetical protein